MWNRMTETAKEESIPIRRLPEVKEDLKSTYNFMRTRNKIGTGRSTGSITKQRIEVGEVKKKRDVSKVTKIKRQAERIIRGFLKKEIIKKPQKCEYCGGKFKGRYKIQIVKVVADPHSQLRFETKRPKKIIPWKYDIQEYQFLCRACKQNYKPSRKVTA